MEEFVWSDPDYVRLTRDLFLASTVLYGYHAVRLIGNYRILHDRRVLLHFGLTLSTAALCGFTVVALMHQSQFFTMRLAHLLWCSGAFIYYFYARSLSAYTGLRAGDLELCARVFLGTAAAFAVNGLLLVTTGESLLFAPTPLATPNVLLAAAGGNLYSPTTWMVGLVGVNAIASMWMFSRFIHFQVGTRKRDGWLLAGAILSVIGLLNEFSMTILRRSRARSRSSLTYTSSILWLSNMPEIFRISALLHRETLRKVLELELEVRELDRTAALATIAGSIAHDVNNPLAVIQLRLQALRGRLPEGQVGALDQITRNSRRIGEIVTGYLGLLGSVQARDVHAVSCRELVDSALELSGPRFGLNGTRPPEVRQVGVVGVVCHRILVELALTNLLNNASDALRARADGWIRIDIEAVDETACIRIVDGGPGLGGEKAPGEGHGIGLRTARRLIESQGGTLAQDLAAAHTTFVVALPRADEAPSVSRTG